MILPVRAERRGSETLVVICAVLSVIQCTCTRLAFRDVSPSALTSTQSGAEAHRRRREDKSRRFESSDTSSTGGYAAGARTPRADDAWQQRHAIDFEETVGAVLLAPGHASDLASITQGAVLGSAAVSGGAGEVVSIAQELGNSQALTLVGWAGVAEAFVSAGIALSNVVDSGSWCIKTFSFGKVLVSSASGILGTFANLHSGDVTGIGGAAVASTVSTATLPLEAAIGRWCEGADEEALQAQVEESAHRMGRLKFVPPWTADHDVFSKRLVDFVMKERFSELRPTTDESNNVRTALENYVEAFVKFRLVLHKLKTAPGRRALKDERRQQLERIVRALKSEREWRETFRLIARILTRGLKDITAPNISISGQGLSAQIVEPGLAF